MARQTKINPMAWVGLVAIVFMCIAFVGSYLVSNRLNTTATETGSSAGRSGDPQPNALQTQSQPSTSGTNPNTAVPPAR